MAQKVYVADCALAYVRTSAGGYSQVFFGDPVPDGYDEADVKRLVDEKFLREATLEELGGIVAPPPAVGGGQVPGVDPADAGSDTSPAAPESVTEKSTHQQIDAYAAAQTPPVDLSGATTKAEKLDKISAASS
jgi:hypothetical protein